MLIQRNTKLEQMLTADCKKALEEINRAIRLTTLSDLEFDQDDQVIVNLETLLDTDEEHLVKEMLDQAGWKNIRVKDQRVSFYF
jgi:hypothetical protein